MDGVLGGVTMTKQRTFILSAVASGVLFFGWAAQAGFPWVRIPATACVVQSGSSGTTFTGAIVSATAASNTDVTMICPVATDTPDQYNRFNVHFTDRNSQRPVVANACVDFFGMDGGACFGTRNLSSSSFVTPTGAVTSGTYPVFDTWANNFGDFPFIRVRIPARQSCTGGAACFPASTLRGLFLFTEM